MWLIRFKVSWHRFQTVSVIHSDLACNFHPGGCRTRPAIRRCGRGAALNPADRRDIRPSQVHVWPCLRLLERRCVCCCCGCGVSWHGPCRRCTFEWHVVRSRSCRAAAVGQHRMQRIPPGPSRLLPHIRCHAVMTMHAMRHRSRVSAADTSRHRLHIATCTVVISQ